MDRGVAVDGASTLPVAALGLMSGTSLDGIDIALLETDGREHIRRGPAATVIYSRERRCQLRELLDAFAASPNTLPQGADIAARDLTLDHARAVAAFLKRENLAARTIGLLGFHGQTVLHRPEIGKTLQLGDAALLAERTGINVIHDFRTADMEAGGQGAPLVPLYHAALAASREEAKKPVCVVNLGGIANLTWIAPDLPPVAFDIAPCNGLLDDWLLRHTGKNMDEDGCLARQGRVCEEILAAALAHPFLKLPPPKSLDRLDFSLQPFSRLAPADGAATIVAFIAAAVAGSVAHLPRAPHVWLLCGGGRHNPVLREELARRLSGSCRIAEEWGWPGDSLEAEAFAWLAVRSKRGLPLSLPSTTGVSQPTCGGREYPAPEPLVCS